VWQYEGQKKFNALWRKILFPSRITTVRTSNIADIFTTVCKAVPSYLQDNGMQPKLLPKRSHFLVSKLSYDFLDTGYDPLTTRNEPVLPAVHIFKQQYLEANTIKPES
jgi:hypothetical protein